MKLRKVMGERREGGVEGDTSICLTTCVGQRERRTVCHSVSLSIGERVCLSAAAVTYLAHMEDGGRKGEGEGDV